MPEIQKSLLIVEDRDYLRTTLREAFEDRGFRVSAAGTTQKATELFWETPDLFDVLLLDMHLQEAKTGADFGMEVKTRHKGWQPEFLIWSAYSDIRYYKKAMRLGAAAYLRKASSSEPDIKELIRHVQALMVRRALSGDRPGLPEKIFDIVRHSQSEEEAADRFCMDILRPELIQVLSNRFVLLFSDKNGVRYFDDQSDEPQRAATYEELQLLVFSDLVAPFVVPADRDLQGAGITGGSAFIRLVESDDFRLSLGFLKEEPEDEMSRLTDDPLEMARTLTDYIRYSLPKNLLQITRLWAESNIEKRMHLESASKYSLYVGQEVLSLFDKALEEGLVTREERFAPLWKIRKLGEELRSTGELLGPLNAEVVPKGAPPPSGQKESAAFLWELWDELVETGRIADRELLHIEGSCALFGRGDYLRSAFSRIFLWFNRRIAMTPDDQKPGIFVKCRPREGRSEIRFEDRSRRLSPRLRKHLFIPFSAPIVEPMAEGSEPGHRLGLYLARVLVEAHDGFLEDRTKDETMPGTETGHCFVVDLPSLKSKPIADDSAH